MLSTGSHVGPYEIISLLGAGGMGEVYRARDSRLNRTVAIKILSPEVASDTGRRQRFELEARAASALNHPNIMSVFDTGAQDALVYIVTELIDGEALRDMIKRGPLPVSKVIDLGGQIADGLAAAHAAGIVHRDLKPENIMVTRDGRAKILDFGLARQTAAFATTNGQTADATRTTPGTVMGTAAYMSPEQVRGEEVDHRSDIFSLGLSLHECLTGKQTFERPTGVEVMTAILREDAPELPETVSPALRQIVFHCLEKEPDRRFHSARDLAFALRTVSAARGSGTSLKLEALQAEMNAAVAPAPASRGRTWFWPSVSAFLALILAALAIAHITELQPIELGEYRITPFATEDEPESEGAWSPDGNSIAYLKTIGGVPQVMVRSFDSDAPVQLTRSSTPVRQVFWKPDSSLIYYLSQDARGVLWGVSPSGGQAARILDIPDRLISGSISPDGKTLAVWRGMAEGLKVRGEVWTSSPPGSPLKQYGSALIQTSELNGENRIYFSPDGASILLLTGFNASEIWLMPFPTPGPPRRLFAKMDLGISAKASWLPDSRHAILAFAPALSGQSSLWLADFKRERMRRLTVGTLGHDHPSLSPDGRRMVFTTIKDDYDLLSLPLDGGAPKRLVPNSRNETSPSWSPQGDQIIYSTDRNGQREIWIHNFKAGIDRPIMTQRQFPPGTTRGLVNPVFSPDGNRFAFVRYSADEPVTIWVAPSVGGAPIRMTPEYMQAPVWSPDSGSIAGLMQRDNPWQPAVVGVGADMAPHIVPKGPICRTPLDWSPKDDWLACESYEGLMLFSPDGSKSRKFPPLNAVAVVFSHDGGAIFAAAREGGRTLLKSLNLASGEVRTLADYGSSFTISGGLPFQTRLSLAPDGKSLAASALMRQSDLWLLEGYPLPRPWWRFWR